MTVAYLEEHSYPDGYGHRNLDKPFWIARCDDPSHGPIALNSGHHYTADAKHFAEELIARHDADEHAGAHAFVKPGVDFGGGTFFQARCTCGWVCGIAHRVPRGGSAQAKLNAELIALGEFEQHYMAVAS